MENRNSTPQKPHPESKPTQDNKEGPSNITRRGILAATIGALVSGPILRSDIFHGSQKKGIDPLPKKNIEKEKGPPSRFWEARSRVDAKVSQIEANNRVVSRVRKAKNSLHQTELPLNGEGIALYFSGHTIQDVALAIPSVTTMRRFLSDPTRREFRVTTLEDDVTKRKTYGITNSDMHVDIGVSSRLSVEQIQPGKKEKRVVLAVKRARYDQGRNQYGEYVTYTPAHSDLRTKEVIRDGLEYVDTVIENAQGLFPKDLNPRIFRLSVEVARRVAVIEHIDPYEFQKRSKHGGRGTKDLYDIALAEYALNLNTAYNHLINSVGAGGMMQIIPKTYRDVRRKIIEEKKWFTDKDIPEDIDEGRKDPLVSAIISIALSYLNYELKASLLKNVTDQDALLVLASMYNGSPNLLNKILEDKGTSKVLRPHKKGAKKDAAPRTLRQKLLRNGKGNKLKGTPQTENENYIEKFIMYDEFTKNT